MTQRPETPHGAGGGGAFGFVRNGYDQVNALDLTTADLEGATVYGRNDETLGTVRALQIGSDDVISHAVVDVGGFLGIGTHSVLVPFDQFTVLREGAGPSVRVHLDTTQDQLKVMPAHGS